MKAAFNALKSSDPRPITDINLEAQSLIGAQSVTTAVQKTVKPDNVPAGQRVVCYYTNWSQYRPEGGKFFPESIDSDLCTHIIYAFAKISGDSVEAFEWNDEDTEWSSGNV
jgi:GH18 family chitinase